MTATTEVSQVHTRRSDVADADPVEFCVARSTTAWSGEFFEFHWPSEIAFVDSGIDAGPPVQRRPVSARYAERLVEEYTQAAMRHVRTRQLPDGYWIADVVGIDGAWSDGDTAEDAIAALPDILFDWAMLKIADQDRDIPPVGGINLNSL